MPDLTTPALPPGTLSTRAQPALETGDLILRPFTLDDIPALVAVYEDLDIQRWHGRTLTVEEAATWIQERRDGWQNERVAEWCVERRGHLVGRMGLRTLDLHDGNGEIAYWTAPAHRGQAIARTALECVTAWAFRLGLVRLELMHSVANPASCHVATRGDYALEGVRRRAALHPDGWHDMHLHARLSRDGTSAAAR